MYTLYTGNYLLLYFLVGREVYLFKPLYGLVGQAGIYMSKLMVGQLGSCIFLSHVGRVGRCLSNPQDGLEERVVTCINHWMVW